MLVFLPHERVFRALTFPLEKQDIPMVGKTVDHGRRYLVIVNSEPHFENSRSVVKITLRRSYLSAIHLDRWNSRQAALG